MRRRERDTRGCISRETLTETEGEGGEEKGEEER